MLQLKQITKSYARGDHAAVNAVSLSIDEGEHMALVGESGCGKTTLLRLLAGLEAPDSGSIYIGDKEVASDVSWIPAEKRGIGLVFQGGALFPHLDVAANIAYGLHRLSREERKAVVGDMLKLIGLPDADKRYPHELSGGERQRVAIARALAPKPEAILLDEPFSNLDPYLRERLRNDLSRILREVKTTCILVTHDMSDAMNFGDRVAVMRKGNLQQVGKPNLIVQRPANEYCAQLFLHAGASVLPGLSQQKPKD